MNTADFDKFHAASIQRLVGALYVLTGDLAQAQDVVQQAFIRAWDHRSKLDVNPEMWVRATAYRLARNRWRWPGRRPVLTLEPILLPDPELATALRALPPAQRHVIVLRQLCGRSVEQIAIEIGAPVDTVEARLARGRAALRRRLPIPDDDHLDDALRSTLQRLSDRARDAELPSAAATIRALGAQRRRWRILGSAGLAVAAVTTAAVIAVTSTALSSPRPISTTVSDPAPDPANDIGYLAAAQLVDGHLMVTFDRVIWRTTTPNGHQIINNNPRLRTFTVNDSARLFGNVQLGGHRALDSTRISRQQLIERTAKLISARGHGPLVSLAHSGGINGPVRGLTEISKP